LAKQFLQHAYRVADDIVFLITLHHIFDLRSRIADMEGAGFGIKEVLLCETPEKPWPQSGFQLGAVHLQRNYRGTITWGWLDGQKLGATHEDGTATLPISPQRNRLKPFFHRFGSKWRIAPRYSAPRNDTIIEPFAGSAAFSMLYPERQVLLFDLDPIICAIWHYLIHVSEAEIMALPIDIDHVDELRGVPQEVRWLVGFWMNKGTTVPGKMSSAWRRKYGPFQHGVYWSPEVRQRIAMQLRHIRHWQITQASYEQIPNMRATWFIDAPYDNKEGEHYKFGRLSIDYRALGEWCRSRSGQVVVCEHLGAQWLPFRELGTFKGQRKESREAIWTNDGDHLHHSENESTSSLRVSLPISVTSTEKLPSSSGSLAVGGLNNPSAVAGDKYSGCVRVLTPNQGTVGGSVERCRRPIILPQQKIRVPTLFWACPRPKTKHWGSGQVWDRNCKVFGTPDAAFGKTDGIPEGIVYYDLSNGYDWKRLPLPDNFHLFGFWDPPYFNDDHTRFKMFKPEAQEIWRVCKRLAILHPMIYPTSWFAGGRREAMVAVTFGSLKIIRCLQIFTKK
jgi:hypothetical protein